MVLVCKEFVSINVISLSDREGVISRVWLGVLDETNERSNEAAKDGPCIVEDSGSCDGFRRSECDRKGQKSERNNRKLQETECN